MTHAFGDGEPFTVGVEEELLLVDPGDLTPFDGADRVLDALPGDLPGEVMAELHRCELELVTGVCASAGEAVGALATMRGAVTAAGADPIGCGMHPAQPPGDAAITPKERYRLIRELLGDTVSTPVAGLHVHVGMPDPDTAIRAYNGLRRHLPLLQALAANSPYRGGRDSGLASARDAAMRAWGRTGVPRALRDLEDFEVMSERLAGAAEVADYTFFWWKIRPHPRLGTVEVRTMDTQTSLATTAGLAALVHALALHEATAPPAPEMPAELLDEGMFRAGRYGVEGTLPDLDGTLRPVGAVLAEALALAAPHARDLGCEDELSELARLPAEGGGAGRQRAVHATGGVRGLLDWLVRETAGSRPLDS